MTVTNFSQKVSEDSNEPGGRSLAFTEESLPDIAYALSHLYGQSPRTVIQEYVSNSLDSHVKAGQTQPVQITSPSAKNNFILTIEDKGTGMDFDKVNGDFSNYGSGEKTKDNSQIGGYGFGAKSAFSMADKFSGHTVKDGLRTDFRFVKDSINFEPKIFVDPSYPTNEPSGFRIDIPYGKEYYAEHIHNLFVGLPSGLIEIDGEPLKKSIYDPELYEVYFNADGSPSFAIEKEKTRITGNTYIVLGGIKYPAPSEDFNIRYKIFHDVSVVKRHNIYLFAPLASLKPTPSREALIMNDVYINSLQAIIDSAESLLVSAIELEFMSASTLNEAQKVFFKWTEEYAVLNSKLKALKKWRNVDMSNSFNLINGYLTQICFKNPLYFATNLNENNRATESFSLKSIKLNDLTNSKNNRPLLVTYNSARGETTDGIRKNLNILYELYKYKNIYALDKDSPQSSNSNLIENLHATDAYNNSKTYAEVLQIGKEYRAKIRKEAKDKLLTGEMKKYLSYAFFQPNEAGLCFKRYTTENVAEIKDHKIFYINEADIKNGPRALSHFVGTQKDYLSIPGGYNTDGYLRVANQYIEKAGITNYQIIVKSKRTSLTALQKIFTDVVDLDAFVQKAILDDYSLSWSVYESQGYGYNLSINDLLDFYTINNEALEEDPVLNELVSLRNSLVPFHSYEELGVNKYLTKQPEVLNQANKQIKNLHDKYCIFLLPYRNFYNDNSRNDDFIKIFNALND